MILHFLSREVSGYLPVPAGRLRGQDPTYTKQEILMKRVITTSVVAGLLGALGYVPVASAEGTLYGSVRSGIVVMDDGDADAMWDIGSYDGHMDHESSDRLFSRIGVKASHELDNGMMAGLHIEKRLDNFRTRHQNVYLQGGMGRVTLGQQGAPVSRGDELGRNQLHGRHWSATWLSFKRDLVLERPRWSVQFQGHGHGRQLGRQRVRRRRGQVQSFRAASPRAA